MDYAKLIEAIAALMWPTIVLLAIYLFRKKVIELIEIGNEFAVEFMGAKVAITPTKVERNPSEEAKPTDDENKLNIADSDPIPPDYIFINHTSFLREDKQKEFIERTGVNSAHYDIRVIVDSYYKGALDRIVRVEYVLHQAYPEPIQVRTNAANKFLLKELANGEYVLIAKVYLRDKNRPIVLHRYISLYPNGPKISA